MTKFRLATPTQAVVMTIAWLGVLAAIDYAKTPRVAQGEEGPARPKAAGIALWINHLSSPGCFGAAHDALAAIPWIDAAQVLPRAPITGGGSGAEAASAQDDGGWIDVGMTSLTDLDFVEIDHILREHGMVVSRMQFGGPPHFRLEAKVRCCGKCEEAVGRIVSLDRARSMPRLRWVDSVAFDRAMQKVTVHARFQGADDVIDVADLLGAFDEVGLPAFNLKVLEEKEGLEPAAAHEHSPDEPAHEHPSEAPAHEHSPGAPAHQH